MLGWLAALFGAGFAPACEQPTTSHESDTNETSSGRAMTSKGAAGCQALRGSLAQTECLTKWATGNDDVKLCELADTIVASPACFEALARKWGVAKYCEAIKPALRRERCLSKLGEETNDPATCRLIENAVLRGDCYQSIVKRDPQQMALCDEVPRRDSCYADAALHDRPELCERVGTDADAPSRRACFLRALQPSHRFKRENCVRIDSATPRAECLAQAAAWEPSADDCVSLANPEIADACWFHTARAQASACTHIQNPDLKRRCARDYWSHSGSGELCALLGSPELTRHCLDASTPR